jgi:hypothetical protein
LAKTFEAESKKLTRAEIKEKEIHEFILDFCKGRRWIALHGSMAHKTHRTPGEPDFVILSEGGEVTLIECKSGKGKLSDEQRNMGYWAELLGHKIHVVRSIENAANVLHSLGKRNSK